MKPGGRKGFDNPLADWNGLVTGTRLKPLDEASQA